MSAEGYLHLYLVDRPAELSSILRRLLGSTSASTVSAWSTPSDLSEWEFFKSTLMDSDVYEEIPIRSIGATVPIDDAIRLANDSICLRLDIVDTQVGNGLREEIAEIPVEIRNGFQLARGFSVWCGWHDIFESAEHEEGFFFDRAYLSIVFTGFGSPTNWQETRRIIMNSIALLLIRSAFEDFTGRLQQCLYWNI